MGSVNLYDVLNIKEDATLSEIKTSYKDLAKKFHPDKPGGDSDMFELVTHAYNILLDPQTKLEYDKVHNLNKQIKTHNNLRESARSYYDKDLEKLKDLKDLSNSKDISNSKVNFNKTFETLDKKHNYKRGQDDNKLNEQDARRRLQDVQLSRDQDLIECTNEELFEPGQFNLHKFNSAFDLMNKDNANSSSMLINYTGAPGAWNDSLSNNKSSFSTIDNYEDLYVEDNLSNINLNVNKKKLTKKDIAKIEVKQVKSWTQEEDKRHFEDKLAERELEDTRLKTRTMKDFDTSNDCGGFGIFSSLGLDPTKNSLTLEDDKDLKEKYNKLVDYRKQD
jgi:curved DNA-binding protein CbpA